MEIKLSRATIKNWLQEIEDIDRQMIQLRDRRSRLLGKVEAAHLILSEDLDPEIEDAVFSFVRPFKLNPDDTLPMNILQALGNIAQPINKPFLIKELLRFGIPESKLGTRKSYFYTALGRLAEDKLIEKQPDGKIGLTEKGKAKLAE